MKKGRQETFEYRPGPRDRTVLDRDGNVKIVPKHWALLPPGDATLTRRVKAAGEHWLVQGKRGRRTFSHGVWVDAEIIKRVKEELKRHRETPQYAKAKKSAAVRREKVQGQYVEDFAGAIKRFLNFHPMHQQIGDRLTEAVTVHATPVGSGTVARTKRIPIEQRAEAAVIAWMRHQTTAYDQMKIANVKGKRREVRRQLAGQSKRLLASYREGLTVASDCPLSLALSDD